MLMLGCRNLLHGRVPRHPRLSYFAAGIWQRVFRCLFKARTITSRVRNYPFKPRMNLQKALIPGDNVAITIEQ